MAVAFKAAGTGFGTQTSGASLDCVCPATVDAGDILIAHIYFRDFTSEAPATPSGWSLLAGPHDIETLAHHWLYGKLADGSEDGAAPGFGTNAVTFVRAGRIYSFSGYVSGSLSDVVPAASFSHISHATDPQMPTVTTTVAGALAVAIYAQVDDNSQLNATGETGGDWSQPVASFEHNPLATDFTLAIQTCTPTADPGTVTGGSASTANDPVGTIGFEIRPNAPGGGTAEFVPRALIL